MEIKVIKDDRLDRFLRHQNLSPWMGKRAWEEALGRGWVKKNGQVVKKPGTEVRAGDIVSVSLPPLGLSGSQSQADFLQEKGGLYFFSKPAGVDTYPLLPFEVPQTFAHRVASYFSHQKILTVEEFEALGEPPVLDGGFLQRLDRNTSGILATAIDKKTKQKFRELFSGSVEKEYFALCSSVPKEGEHAFHFSSLEGETVKAELSKSLDKSVKLKVKVLKNSEGLAFVSVSTNQGLRHVVRAGMAALGAPLVGDLSYGGKPLAPHHLLHAFSLKIPGLGEFSAPIARSFLDCAEQLGFNGIG